MRQWLPWAFALVSIVGCATAADPVTTSDGVLVVQLRTPNADDGGVLFRVQGAGIDSVTAVSGTVFTRHDGDDVTVAVVGALRSGPVARLWVPKGSQANTYLVRLLQVARTQTYQQRATDDYQLRIE